MNHVKISQDDVTATRDFSEGNPVQVRIMVDHDDTNYQKGRLVKVHYNDREADAVIVSDPIVISRDLEKKSKVLSLVVEQDLD